MAICIVAANGAVPETSGECVSPCGLHASLCTLRVSRSAQFALSIINLLNIIDSLADLVTQSTCSRGLSAEVSCFVFKTPPSHSHNTRYEWLAKPCPIGTYTLKEATSFAWRTNHWFCLVT